MTAPYAGPLLITDALICAYERRVVRAGPLECWRWTGSTAHGYGRLRHEGRAYMAHRIGWLLARGAWPSQIIDHLCRLRECQNPGHMEDVDNRTNVLRGVSRPAILARLTVCHQGHPFVPGSFIVNRQGERRCLQCKTAERRARYERNREQYREYDRLRYQRNKAAKAAVLRDASENPRGATP